MKLKYIIPIIAIGLLTSCSLDEPDTQIQDIDFPLRLQIDEEGADLPDAEDYGIGISFADYIGDLPATAITLSYTLEGSEDFSNVEIDEILYEYEDDDCVYERAITFTNNTITIPVDPDLGTVPEEFEVIVNFGLEEDAEASDGDFTFVITALSSAANVVFSDANIFEYGILDNDLAGEWILELDEASFNSLQSAFGNISADLSELTFADITGEVKLEFGFEEMKMEIVLNEEEEVTECENGEVETDMENLIVEIEADYDAEDGELVLEGSYFNEDDEELDFIAELAYSFDASENLILSINLIIGEDNYESGDELFTGETSFTLVKD